MVSLINSRYKMAYILKFDSVKMIYFAIPKAANTSIRHFLSQFMGADPSISYKNIHQQIQWDGLNRSEARMINKDYLSFTVTRNPWDKVVSVYSNKICGDKFHKPLSKFGFSPDMNFKSFIDLLSKIPDKGNDIHLTSQWGLLQHQGKLLPQLIFDISELHKLEFLIKSWSSHNGVEASGNIKVTNQSVLSNNFIDFMNDQSFDHGKKSFFFMRAKDDLLSNKNFFKDKIYTRYKKDIDFFGYEFPY